MEKLVKTMHALGSHTRMRIVAGLAGSEALCVGALSRNTGISQSAVSQHLRILNESGLVSSMRRGNFIHYRLEKEAVEAALNDLREKLLLDTEDTGNSCDSVTCDNRENEK